MTAPTPYPFDALIPYIEALWKPEELDHKTHIGIRGQTAQLIGVNRQTVARWQRCGLPTYVADRAACRLGYHPANIWPEWWTS